VTSAVIPNPPDELNFVGPGGFAFVGEQFLGIFTELAGLRKSDRVLDVGCGIGRMAIPLAGYLDESGSYEGLDIVRLGIDWCRKEISSSYPRFQFHHADVFNRGYNPGGRADPATYRFPFEKDEFDFVFLTSVFTHMLPIDIENYAAEIARVLKPDGRCVATFYIRNEESEQLRNAGKSRIVFSHPGNGYWTTNVRVPEDLVCFDEPYVRGLFTKNGLTIAEPIHFGKWAGRTGTLRYQDVVVARKTSCGQLAYPQLRARRRAAALLRRLFHAPLQKFFWRSATIGQVERAQDAARRQQRAA
jgi:SAM-dependent methyltransferase